MTTDGGGQSSRSPGGPGWCLLGLLAFSALVFGRAAASLPFWYDESLTVRLSRLAVPGELWRALTAGFDLNPPLIYLATGLTRLLPGPETLTARLPGLIGYVVLLVSFFLFLRRRVGGWFALSAVALIPLAEYTIRFATEARAYMLLLGVTGCALVCWQATVERASRFAPVGLTVAVASALLLHVWALLLPFALAIGEALEAARARRVRWRVVWALAAAAPALLLYPALLRASTSQVFDRVVYGPTTDKLLTAFRSTVPRLRVLAAAVAAAAVIGWWRSGRAAALPRATPWAAFPPPELAVLVVLLLSPLVPYVYATLATGAFMTRYALFAVPAVAGLVSAALHGIGRGDRLAGQAAAVVCLIGVVLYLPPKVPTTGTQNAVVDSLASLGDRLDPGVPLVLVNPVDVTAFDEQADDDLRARAVFVADPGLALAYTGANAIELGYLRGEPYLGIRVRRLSYAALAGGYPRLYLVGKWQALSWLPQRLKDEGWLVTEIGGTRQSPVFEARRGQ
jgi:hypothetical protein